ncbi:MAG: hypothetical protein HY726_04745 [Candidatus Rokubacteria bacterium]|nr:hypothetical protein [Candidatus Rokubacteria bacterium]
MMPTTSRGGGEGAGLAVNIGPGERRKRLALSGIMLGVGTAIAVALVAEGAALAWRIALFLPFWAAALGFFQARGKT